MMRFRLHSMVAIVIVMLLLPTLALAQKPAPTAPASGLFPTLQRNLPRQDQEPSCAGYEWALSGYEQGSRGPRTSDL